MLHRWIIRRSFVLGAAAAVLPIRLVRAQAPHAPEKSRLRIAVGMQAAFSNLPLTIADRLGYFTAEGVEVELLDLANAQRAQQAVTEGAADVAACAFDGLFEVQARKHPLRAFALLSRAPQVAFGVAARHQPAIRSVAELRGRKLAIAAPGASARLVAALVLAREGLALDDVQLVESGGIGATLLALRAGQVDAVVHTEPVISLLEQKGDIGLVADTRSLKGTQQLFGGLVPATTLLAAEQSVPVLASRLQASTNAVVRALKWLQTAGPSDLIRAVPEAHLLGDRGLYLAAFTKLRESIALDGVIPEDGVRTMLRALQRVEPAVLAGKVELERLYTNEFARKAKDRFRA